MHYAKTAKKVREQIIKFSGELSSGLPKVVRPSITEAIYGIQARQSVHLTEIARSLEDIRLLTYKRLQNMMALVLAVAYFAIVYLEIKTKLRVLARHVLKAARRLFGIPDFRFYALANGIRELLFGRQTGLEGFIQMLNTETMQLKLFDP